MSDHQHPLAAPGAVLLELAFAGLAGHVSQLLALLPGWVGGVIGGLVMHGVLRLFGPTLDDAGKRIHARVTGRHRALPADAVRLTSPPSAAEIGRALDAPKPPDDATG